MYTIYAYGIFFDTYQVAQKGKPLPNDHKNLLNGIKDFQMRLDLFVKLKY